jgi:UDP-3-O-[3-hydroxymyristoyl] glucosamine N-acyltransferase
MNAQEIAEFLGLELCGRPDLPVTGFSGIGNCFPGAVVFAKKFKQEYVDLLNDCPGVLAIVTPEFSGKLLCPYIVSSNPRLDYIRVLARFFEPVCGAGSVNPTAVVEEGAEVDPSAVVGPFCYVSSGSKIGARTVLHSSVTVDSGSVIGSDCEIKSGVVIGQSGFGFERDSAGNPVHFPHFGKVVIGDRVYVGANTAIDRGTLGDTVIEDDVKIDNLVHIAHNCHIMKGAFVIAGTSLGGGTRVGKNAWLAPNVSVKEQSVIGDEALVGLGAVVIRNVESGSVVAGNPAKELKGKDK